MRPSPFLCNLSVLSGRMLSKRDNGLLKSSQLISASYRDSLYSGRRFPVNRNNLNTALSALKRRLDEEDISNEVKARRYKLPPCEERNVIKFKKRQGVFNKQVSRHVAHILEIEESLK